MTAKIVRLDIAEDDWRPYALALLGRRRQPREIAATCGVTEAQVWALLDVADLDAAGIAPTGPCEDCGTMVMRSLNGARGPKRCPACRAERQRSLQRKRRAQ